MRKNKSRGGILDAAPPKTKLKQSPRQTETPKMTQPMKYERSSVKSRS